MISCTRLYRVYRGPYGANKEKEDSKPSNVVMREHERGNFTKYHCQHKGDQDSINSTISLDLRYTYQYFLQGFRR